MKTVRLYVATGLLSLLAASCDNDSEVASGKRIAVDISRVAIREGGSEEAMRSVSVSPLTGRPEIAMTSQPIGNGMLLEMSLEPDEGSPLRATTEALEETKTFRVIALDADGKYVSHGDYVVTSAGVDKTGGDLHVPEGVSHDFICLSYNSVFALPAASFTEGEVATLALSPDGAGDLLYQKVTKTITEADKALSFTLIHQYNQVRLTIDGSYNEWDVSSVSATDIYLKPDYQSATMKLQDMSKQSGTEATDRYFADWQSSGAYSQTSATVKVFTAGEAIRVVVPAGAVEINSNLQPGSNTEVVFPKIPVFVPGYNYVLRVRIRIPRWAGSNIYWDEISEPTKPKLTFDLEGTTTHQGYQGVFFKWGSLVGISPALTSGAGNSDRDFDSNTPIYVPYGYPSDPKWEPTTGFAKGYTSWGNNTTDDTDIPYMDPRYTGADYGRNNTSLMDATWNDPVMYQSLRGDICQYLGATDAALAGYRMPTSYEFGSITTDNSVNIDGWTTGGDSNINYSLGDVYGSTDLWSSGHAWAKNSTMGNVTFPVSGYRTVSDGTLSATGYTGCYWSGSAYSSTHGHDMNFDNSYVHPGSAHTRSYGYSVRCVRNN
jgi:hypothetical protein